jgi:rhodanese-related sulfurtransferase
MINRKTLSFGLALLFCLSTSAWSYDSDLAASYAKLFEPVAGAKAGKALHLMKPEMFLKTLQSNKPILTIDVRTPNEASVVGMTLPGSLAIPVNKVFLQENLERIPQDKTVVIVCLTGTRATAVGTALRHVGFNNVYVLKGGIMALAEHVNPKTVNPPPQKGAKQ